MKTMKHLLLLLSLLLPFAVQAQFFFTTNNGAITITSYTGPGGDVVIPDATNGYPVKNIGASAFYNKTGLTNVTIPNSITNIGRLAFNGCINLTNLTIPTSVISIGDTAFAACGMANLSIPNNVTNLGVDSFTLCQNLKNATICDGATGGNGLTYVQDYAFYLCTNLTNAIIGNGVGKLGGQVFCNCYQLTSVIVSSNVVDLGVQTFRSCSNLTGVFFEGNPPAVDPNAFLNASKVIVYYLPGTTGWGTNFAGRPTALWRPQAHAENPFGINIAWANGRTVAVDACTDLTNPIWLPVATNAIVNRAAYFSDPQWTNNLSCFYRLRSVP